MFKIWTYLKTNIFKILYNFEMNIIKFEQFLELNIFLESNIF
jgi:hypothetical protein